jgi:hypothetical protein
MNESEELITEFLPNIGRFCCPSVTVLLRFSGVMSHVTYMFVLYSNSRLFFSTITGTQTHGEQDDITKPNFSKEEEKRK